MVVDPQRKESSMRTIGSKKRFALIAGTTAAVLLGGGIAVGYWSTTGSGSGSADVGTSSALEIDQTNTTDLLYPGGPAADIDLDITNNTDGDLRIDTLSAVITTGVVGCNASDFVFTPSAAVTDVDVPAGVTSISAAATISMTNTSLNQDLCKNADLTLAFSSN
jgi:hypothetical protein